MRSPDHHPARSGRTSSPPRHGGERRTSSGPAAGLLHRRVHGGGRRSTGQRRHRRAHGGGRRSTGPSLVGVLKRYTTTTSSVLWRLLDMGVREHSSFGVCTTPAVSIILRTTRRMITQAAAPSMGSLTQQLCHIRLCGQSRGLTRTTPVHFPSIHGV